MKATSLSAGLALLAGIAMMPIAAAQDSAQVAQGMEIYARLCVLCHGTDGKRGEGFQVPIWGDGSFLAAKFGNAHALLEYMQIMPFNDPRLMDDKQRLDVVAYMLAEHGSIPRSGEITSQNASSIPIK